MSPTLFKLSGVDTTAGDVLLEETLGEILGVKTTLLEKDYDDQKGTILFCCQGDDGFETTKPDQLDAHVLNTIGEFLQTPIESNPDFWCKSTAAAISIVDEEEDDEECVEYITEEEAYQLWLEQNQTDENDTDDLSDLVSSPDGHLVKPKHHANHLKEDDDQEQTAMATCTARQLERDPGLFDFDNVERVHYAKVLEFLSNEKDSSILDSQTECWTRDFGSKPIVITGDLSEEKLTDFQQALQESIQEHGADTIARTGNRETLVENGFHNSRAATLSQVVDSRMLEPTNDVVANPNSTIVFNPIHEMPSIFRSESVLGRWINNDYCTTANNEKQMFPNTLWNTLLNNTENTNEAPVASKFTLCIANEGFGIGMHKHGPALFFLTQGTKKWYLSHPNTIDEKLQDPEALETNASPTHPQFYRELSTHKCIQHAGELLLVPNLWYHEIYNLATPTIGIQALADELPVPGTLWVSGTQNEKMQDTKSKP